MSLKKGFIENYFKERERPKTDLATNSLDKVSKYSHNRVFDEPESLKKLVSIKYLNGNNEDEQISKNQKQSDNKPETNLGQSEDKLRASLGQSGDKLRTNLGQSGDKLETQLRTKPETNLGQSGGKLRTTVLLSKSYFSLVGLQQKIIFFIHNQCKLSRDKVTFPLSIESIATHCNTTLLSARKTLQRLEKQNYIIRKEFKNGRGGWTRYEIPKDVFQELLHHENYVQNSLKLETNLGQSGDKLETQLRTQLRTSSLSSSSINNNNTTTTALPENWTNLDFSIGQQFGFTNSHLIQLYKHGGIDPSLIQESIQHFIFDLEKNNKAKEIKTNPLSYFMGILKRVGMYAPPDNYESPKDQAMRIYLEKKKLLESKREAMERELLDLSFQEWLKTLTEHEIDKLIPQEVKNLKLEAPKKAALRTHFEKTIWTNKKNELMDKITNLKEVPQ